MSARIAIISEHASPLATLGGVDAGGQNVYVAQTARHLAAMGFHVDVFTRRDDEQQPAIVEWEPRLRVFHVRAGPAEYVRKEFLLPYMPQFAQGLIELARAARERGVGYLVAHAHFFMSGLCALRLREELGVPYVVTFHALGKVRLIYQPHDEFPRQRAAIEQLVIDGASAIVAECPQDEMDLRRHYRAPQQRIRMIPCGFDPAEFAPVDRAQARHRLGLPEDRPVILQLGRMVPRKGVDTVIRALAILRTRYRRAATLVIVGG
jgi:glycosyltransferase involved in cell wall biosynthesis